jgi:hypothetical protein
MLISSNTCKKRVLIVSFYFPPYFNPGAVRMGTFARYLPEFGWEPEVLTGIDSGEIKSLSVHIDESRIHRTQYWVLGQPKKKSTNYRYQDSSEIKPSRQEISFLKKIALQSARLFRPIYNAPLIDKVLWDPMGWYFSGLNKGRELLASNKFDLIFSTYNPSVPNLIASTLHHQTGIPWIADFRDLWTHNPYVSKMQPFQFLEECWERRVLKECIHLTSVSEPLAKDLELFHSKKATVIYNGFNEDDFTEVVPLTSKFTITYTGQIYTPRLDPTPLFQAIAELKKEGLISSENFEVRFFGNFLVNNPNILSPKYGVEDIVKTFGFIPFKDSIKKQMESTALLILGWDNPGSDGDLPSKVFEYLGTQRPILGIIYKGGNLSRLIQETGSGVVANTAGEIKDVLIKWLTEFKNNRMITSYFTPHPEVINKYSRKESTKKLAKLFDKVTGCSKED